MAAISDEEALAAFQAILDIPATALGLAVLLGSDQALVVFAGENAAYTDLAFSMAGPYRPWAFEQAERMAAQLRVPTTHEQLIAERRRCRTRPARS